MPHSPTHAIPTHDTTHNRAGWASGRSGPIEWMFTAYLAIMAVAMLVYGVVGTRLGSKRTMLLGLGLVVVFATASGLSPSIGVLALFRGGWGLGHRAVLANALIGLSYSYAFFTILAYSPLTLPHVSAVELGFTYFAWGILVAFSSVVLVNMLTSRLSEVTVLIADLILLVLVMIGAGFSSPRELLFLIVISGLFCGVANALFTTLAMEVSPFPRSISSGT